MIAQLEASCTIAVVRKKSSNLGMVFVEERGRRDNLPHRLDSPRKSLTRKLKLVCCRKPMLQAGTTKELQDGPPSSGVLIFQATLRRFARPSPAARWRTLALLIAVVVVIFFRSISSACRLFDNHNIILLLLYVVE